MYKTKTVSCVDLKQLPRYSEHQWMTITALKGYNNFYFLQVKIVDIKEWNCQITNTRNGLNYRHKQDFDRLWVNLNSHFPSPGERGNMGTGDYNFWLLLAGLELSLPTALPKL